MAPKWEALDKVRTKASFTLANCGVSCSTATLLAFGVNDDRHPQTDAFDWHRSGRQISGALKDRGYQVERMHIGRPCDGPTLATFIREHGEGSYVMVSTGGVTHSMALREGQLTDTELRGGARRRVNLVYRVW